MRTAKWKVAVIENRVDKKIVVFASLMVSAQQQKKTKVLQSMSLFQFSAFFSSQEMCIVVVLQFESNEGETKTRRQFSPPKLD